MAPLKLLITQARRHCLARPPPPCHLSLSLRCLSSSEEPQTQNLDPQNDAARRPSQSVPIQPVSYAVKPKDSDEGSPENPRYEWAPTPPRKPREFVNRDWTREDIRYVKDAPSVSPVSYPTRVAPLPEDKAPEQREDGERWDVEEGESFEVERERRRIEAADRARRRLFMKGQQLQEEEVTVPFPTIIQLEKKEKMQVLDLAEAIRQVKANARRKFDETLEAHVRLGIDRKRTDLTVRGTVPLPHGVGKVVRIAFFAEGADAEEARAAGADIVGGVELIEEIARSGKLNADKCFSTPQFMTRLTKIARILGPQGLMPAPKRGTVTSDVTGAVKEAKRGVVDFKMDKTSIVHVGLGKVSYPEEFLRENICAFVNALLHAKPAGLKKTSKYAGYVNSFHICSTMGPGFPVSIQSLSKAADQFTTKFHLK